MTDDFARRGYTPPKRYAHGSRVPGWDEAVDLTKDPAEIPDPTTVDVPPTLRKRIEALMERYPERHSAVIGALHAAQEVHGWCSPQAIEQVACVMQVTPAYVNSIVTFYDMLSEQPAGRQNIFVCTNISCSLRGGDDLLHAMQAAAAGEADINVRSFECLGACDMAPMASVNGVYVGPLELEDAPAIVSALSSGKPVLPAKQLERRPSADPGVANSKRSGGGKQ
jgi:NADH:ubiquinone oxidoreductase subunit E